MHQMNHTWNRKVARDAWFTKPSIAHRVTKWASKVVDAPIRLVVEPSAGDGAFLDAAEAHFMADVDAMDIAPRAHGIVKQDFFTYAPPAKYGCDHVLVLGNPPFGVKSSLAMKFIRHAATFADHVVFILSENFKTSDAFRAQLPHGFTIVDVLELPRDSFCSEAEKVKPNDQWQFVIKSNRDQGHLRVSRMGNKHG